MDPSAKRKAAQMKLPEPPSPETTLPAYVDAGDPAVMWQYSVTPRRWEWQRSRDWEEKVTRPEVERDEMTYGLSCAIARWDSKLRSLVPCVSLREHGRLSDEELARAIRGVASQQWWPEDHPLRRMPSRLLLDLVGMMKGRLKKAWVEYAKGGRRRPRYKGRKNPLRSLGASDSSTEDVRIERNRVYLPGLSAKYGLGTLRAKGVGQRYPLTSPVKAWRIVSKASGWYLQLTHDVPRVYKAPKFPDVAVGIDPGVVHAIAQSDGRFMDAPRPLLRYQAQRKRLQQALARREMGSKGWQDARSRLSKLEEKIAAVRKAWNHSRSTYLVESYGAIAFEKNDHQALRRRPEAIGTLDGKFLKNGAEVRSRITRGLVDVSSGQLAQMIETKAKAGGRVIFEKIDSRNNSLQCVKCANIDERNRVSQARFKCTNCGFEINADTGAAINVLNRAFADKDWAALGFQPALPPQASSEGTSLA